MFAVIYRWKLKPRISEKDFIKYWHDGTEKTYKKYGSLGSRLHKVEDGTFLAYAKWPSRKNWDSMMKQKKIAPKGWESNDKYTYLIDGPICLEIIDDLLKNKSHKD